MPWRQKGWSMTELWAARDSDGTLFAYDLEPRWEGYEWAPPFRSDLVEVDGAMLPDLKPGEKCRVELRRIKETDHAK